MTVTPDRPLDPQPGEDPGPDAGVVPDPDRPVSPIDPEPDLPPEPAPGTGDLPPEQQPDTDRLDARVHVVDLTGDRIAVNLLP